MVLFVLHCAPSFYNWAVPFINQDSPSFSFTRTFGSLEVTENPPTPGHTDENKTSIQTEVGVKFLLPARIPHAFTVTQISSVGGHHLM